MKKLLALLLFAVFPAAAQTFTCQQATSSGSFSLSCTPAGVPTPTPPPVPPPPAPPPPPPPGTCPPPSGNLLIGHFDTQGLVTTITMPSGQVASYPLPNEPYLSRNSGTMNIGESTAVPPGTFLEITVSKCPGVIDSSALGCYIGTYVQNYSEMSWFFQLGKFTLAQIQARGYCYAPKTEGPWFFNVRWTYTTTPYWGNYGRYIFQWGNGPY